jgi:hypothetical protein
MAGLTKEGTGGPIYSKPIVKLGDLLARAKDMKNIKQATIVTPKDENQVVMKKEETEQVDETMMGKAGCTSEDDKKKDEKPVDYDKPTFLRKKDDWRKSNPAYLPKPTKEEVELDERIITPGTGTSPDPLLARTGLNKVLRKPRAGQTNLKNIPGGNLPGSQYKFSDDEKTKQRASLKTAIKSTLANKEHGAKRKLPEEIEQLDELDPKTLASYANKAVGDTGKDRSKMIKVADKKLYGNPDLRYKSEGFNTFKGVAAEIKAGTFNRSKPDPELAKQKKKELETSFENKTKKRTEEVSIDETATLDKYIRSMGYDPQHLDKNKKVMFSKTNAYKTFAMSQEGLYDGGQKGTQDIDDHMSPGATARG